jgi:quercetin dioxygenase-like cupin family protein
MTDRLKLTTRETVIVRRSEPGMLEVEGSWAPGGRPPPKHFHPDQDEKFRVITGTLSARVDGTEHQLGQGDALEIPAGAVHQMWNQGEVEARASWQTLPRGRTEEWFRAIHALHEEAEAKGEERPGPLAFGAVIDEFDDVFRLAIAPQAVTKPLVSGLGALGRARGRRPGV